VVCLIFRRNLLGSTERMVLEMNIRKNRGLTKPWEQKKDAWKNARLCTSNHTVVLQWRGHARPDCRRMAMHVRVRVHVRLHTTSPCVEAWPCAGRCCILSCFLGPFFKHSFFSYESTFPKTFLGFSR